MGWVQRIFLGVLWGACLAGQAPAAIDAALPEGSGGRGWELVEVRFAPRPGEVEVSLQDVRGGVKISRRVAGGAGRAWVALPLMAPAELGGAEGGIWRVKVAVGNVAGAGGGALEQAVLELALGRGGGLRLATTDPAPAVGSCVAVRFSEEEILTAPALIFAGCDLVELSPALQSRMTRARALALWAVGVRLVARGDAPPGGELALLVWEPSELLAGTAAWVTPATALARPTLLEPGLGRWHASGMEPQATPTPGVTGVLVGVGPATVVALLLVRGLFRRRASVLAGGVVALAALGGGTMVYLRALPVGRVALAQWRQVQASESAAVGGALVEERLARYEARFESGLVVQCEPGMALYPVAATLGEYWSFSALQLHLAAEGERLTGSLAGGRGLHVESRSAESLGLLPAYPRDAAAQRRLEQALQVTPDRSWWLVDGYVRPAADPEASGRLVPQWAASRPWGRVAGSAWYEMRYQAGHRYFLGEPEGGGVMQVVDFPVPAGPGPAAP